jgi:hypothetical protein
VSVEEVAEAVAPYATVLDNGITWAIVRFTTT